MKDKIAELNERFAKSTPQEMISWFVAEFPGSVAFSSSFGAEDQVITAMLAGISRDVHFFTLDTGRLFQETYDVMHITEQKYGIRFALFFPDAARVEEMVKNFGINLFYESFENRRFCCHVRKMEPLKRALSGVKVWITGQRKDQSVTRLGTGRIEWDAVNQVVKLNPLADWSNEDVWAYIRSEKIPYNELHDKGFPSIGCQPCTRAILPGEDLRAGRWWWELPEFKECGLHKKL
jgi:phosphoadenosine phosphosulfate reductase